MFCWPMVRRWGIHRDAPATRHPREWIVEGTDSGTTQLGPGHRRDSVLPGQAGVGDPGPQLTYGGPFGPLDRLAPGDEIHVTTGQGEHTFQVFGLRRAGDPLPESLADGQGRLELMTADGLQLFPTGVLHVDAQLVSEVQETPTKVLAEPRAPGRGARDGRRRRRLVHRLLRARVLCCRRRGAVVAVDVVGAVARLADRRARSCSLWA